MPYLSRIFKFVTPRKISNPIKLGPQICRSLSRNTPHSIIPATCYGGRHTVTAIPGDGIGPEMLKHVQDIFREACVPVDFEIVNVGRDDPFDSLDKAIISIRRNKVALKGNLETHGFIADGQSRNHYLRAQLNLFANLTRCRNLPHVPTRHENVDIVVIRENTEGEYSMLEHENKKGVVESLKVITRVKCLQIAEFAFKYAVNNNRRKVTAVHKANIMKLGDGLFLDCCRQVASQYPQVQFDAMIIDNCSMQLVANPSQFDVMVTPNLYGNVIVSIICGLTGGPGITPGCNYGDQYALFETATRNSGKSLTGKNVANPVSFIRAACKLLHHVGLEKHFALINEAVVQALAEKSTPDIGGTSTTSEVVESILRHVKEDYANIIES